MRSILITGGSGFIGANFCRHAIQLGWQITVLTRNTQAAAEQLPAGITMIESLDEIDARQPIDAVLNLAGQPLAEGRWTQARKQLFYSSRIGTTDQLYEFFAARQQKPEVIISGSAIGYYGTGNGDDLPIDESAGTVDNFSHQLCSSWEKSAGQFENLDVRIVCLRTGIVLGDKGALAKMLPAFKLALGGPMGEGKQWMPWIHIADMVALIRHCIEVTTLSGPVNATAPNPVTNREFAKQLGTALGRPAVFTMPAMVVKILFGQMGEELLLQGQRVIPRKLQDSDYKFQYAQLDRALADLL